MGRLVMLCLVLASGIASNVTAQIYRCQDGYGNVTYQQNPCDPRAMARKLEEINETVRTLAQQSPSKEVIDGCVRLHGFPVDSPDFQMRSANHERTGDGAWEVVINGTVARGDSRRDPQTLRCPVTGSGVLNADLFRSRRQLGIALERRESLEKADAAARIESEARERSATVGPNNLAKAAERKFLATRSPGATKREVREMLGDPDSIDTVADTCIAPYTRMPYVCRVTTWIYKPAPLDRQTRTTITFNDEDVVTNVVRNVEY